MADPYRSPVVVVSKPVVSARKRVTPATMLADALDDMMKVVREDGADAGEPGVGPRAPST